MLLCEQMYLLRNLQKERDWYLSWVQKFLARQQKRKETPKEKKCWNKRKRWYLYNKQKNIIEMYTKNKKSVIWDSRKGGKHEALKAMRGGALPNWGL